MLIKNKLDKGTSGGRNRLSFVPTYLSTLLHKVNCCVNCPHMSQLVSNTYVAVQCYFHSTYSLIHSGPIDCITRLYFLTINQFSTIMLDRQSSPSHLMVRNCLFAPLRANCILSLNMFLGCEGRQTKLTRKFKFIAVHLSTSIGCLELKAGAEGWRSTKQTIWKRT